MLELDLHLTEDELLALRDRRDEDPRRWKHLLGCKLCKERFAFLTAFKSALGDVRQGFHAPYPEQAVLSFMESPRLQSASEDAACCSFPRSVEEPHPGRSVLAAYFRGTLGERQRASVHEHVLGCERCASDILVLARDSARPERREVVAVREQCRESEARVAYHPGTSRLSKPQLVLGFEEGPGTELLFRVLARPDEAGRLGPGRKGLEKSVEVRVKSSRVTVSAHRKGAARHLDVQVRDLGRRRTRAAASLFLEEEGRPIVSVRTGEDGIASLAVPAGVPEFDLRVDVGWVLPVLLRFRA